MGHLRDVQKCSVCLFVCEDARGSSRPAGLSGRVIWRPRGLDWVDLHWAGVHLSGWQQGAGRRPRPSLWSFHILTFKEKKGGGFNSRERELSPPLVHVPAAQAKAGSKAAGAPSWVAGISCVCCFSGYIWQQEAAVRCGAEIQTQAHRDWMHPYCCV